MGKHLNSQPKNFGEGQQKYCNNNNKKMNYDGGPISS